MREVDVDVLHQPVVDALAAHRIGLVGQAQVDTIGGC
jgi:hypothetical protein